MTTPADTAVRSTELKPKEKLTGKVVKTTLAGAVIDIGESVPGILHVSQIPADPAKRIDELLQVGQSVDVWVRRAKADRIELTMIEPLGLDWKDLKPETVIKGKVVRLETYGAFVEIGAERPGLVHISEMAHGYVKTPQEVVKEGDEIDVMIIDVDRKKKQIRLSMKATMAPPEEKVEIEVPRPKRAPSAAPSKGRPDNAAGGDTRERNPKRSGKPKSEKFEMPAAEPSEPEPTAFEIAWQTALDRQKAEKAARSKKTKPNQQQDEILNRTLKNRLPTN
jgi:predicted RNA-binding protein with RPS1 domain